MSEASGNRLGLAEAIGRHAAVRPDAPAFRFMARDGKVKRTIAWRELHEEGRRIAGALHAGGFAGRRVAIVCPEAADFVVALAGCLLAGAVAVPLPAVATRRAAERIAAIVKSAAPAAMIGRDATLREPWIAATLGGSIGLALEGLADADFEEALLQRNEGGVARSEKRQLPLASRYSPLAPPDGAAPALLQFTSGSTASPRGVMLSHGNLAANCAAIAEAYELDATSIGFSWLPLHHDMGLVGHVLTTFLVGGSSAIMNPLYFLQSPLRWLEQAGTERATITSAPNFAYALCVRAVEEGKHVRGLDLSSLAVAVCGGEPVSAETASRFSETFAAYGFRRSAFAPSYGLAEATLLVASGRRSAGPGTHRRGGNGSPVVSVGRAVRGMAIRIVDDTGRPCREAEIGEIEVAGPSVGTIMDAPAPVEAVVRTGDLGYLLDGELYVTGRRKELIILRGQNVFPTDIEAAALAADPRLKPGGIAAIGVAEGGTETLLVLIEVDPREGKAGDLARLTGAVSQAVSQASGFMPKSVLPVAVGALPRTSSGKLQRSRIAEMLTGGELKPLLVAEKEEV
jgi:acyl-CoA synthetase (AMP-forming)/AMP-acid ligase II